MNNRVQDGSLDDPRSHPLGNYVLERRYESMEPISKRYVYINSKSNGGLVGSTRFYAKYS